MLRAPPGTARLPQTKREHQSNISVNSISPSFRFGKSLRMKAQPPRSGMLFAESHQPQPSAGVCVAEVDGASRGNPGPASYGLVVRAPEGGVAWEQGKFIGRNTNNVAEYHALLAALDYAISHGLCALRVRSDSELLVRQMQGRYKVKSPDLRPLHERAIKASRALEYFAIEYVPREKNRDADRLANEALDRGPGGTSLDRVPATERQSSARESSAAEKPRKKTVEAGPRILARYSGGALHPEAPLDLPDGAEVEIMVVRRQSRE
jgi:ribonuclease HI